MEDGCVPDRRRPRRDDTPDLTFDPPDYRDAGEGGRLPIGPVGARARRAISGSRCISGRSGLARVRRRPTCRSPATSPCTSRSASRTSSWPKRPAGARPPRGRDAERLEARVRSAVGRARVAHRLRPDGGRRRRPGRRCVRAATQVRGDRHDGAAHRRVGHRQGSDRALHPPRVGAAPRAVRRRQLRGAARAAARVGAVRPRARRVHRRAAAASPGRSSSPPAACCFSTKWAR